MPRYILRFRGSGSAHTEDVRRIRSIPDTAIVDSSSDRMMLVDGPEEHLRAALKDMPGWAMIPEQTVLLPDPRKKVLHPPDGTDNEDNS
jgi:hypothetical protein